MKNFKNIITLFIFLFSFSLWAQTPIGGIGGDGGGPKQSWQDIYRNPNLNPVFPSYDIQGRDISFRHLCLMGERVRTKYKHVINPLTDYSKLVFDYLVTDRVREVRVCREFYMDECVEWEIETVEIPMKDTIKVYKKVKSQETGSPSQWTFAFEKEFELEQCEEL